jgi:hypothetical protein
MNLKLYAYTVTTAYAVAAYFTFFGDLRWVSNLFWFYFWLSVVLATLGAFIPTVSEEARERGRSLPIWLSVGIDVAVIGLMIAFGHFFAGAAGVWQISCECAIFQKPTTKETP